MKQETTQHGVRGRLAPSPTGHLHVGNAWAFLWAWLAVRLANGTLVLRMEDIDPARSKQKFILHCLEDLHWLGIDWDEGVDINKNSALIERGTQCDIGASYLQSKRLALYEQGLSLLHAKNLLYPCYCTRKELRTLASAPHAEDAAPLYAGTCRHLTPQERAQKEAEGKKPALRVRCDVQCMDFYDEILGTQHINAAHWGGDFAIRRSDGVVAYQLAVVLDDIAMDINEVVRGEDLVHCTPRQLYLYKCFQAQAPHYAHVPLLLDEEGERLAKRHNSLSLRALREQGVRPQAIIGTLAWLGGVLPEPCALSPQELLHRLLREHAGSSGENTNALAVVTLWQHLRGKSPRLTPAVLEGLFHL